MKAAENVHNLVVRPSDGSKSELLIFELKAMKIGEEKIGLQNLESKSKMFLMVIRIIGYGNGQMTVY